MLFPCVYFYTQTLRDLPFLPLYPTLINRASYEIIITVTLLPTVFFISVDVHTLAHTYTLSHTAPSPHNAFHCATKTDITSRSGELHQSRTEKREDTNMAAHMWGEQRSSTHALIIMPLCEWFFWSPKDLSQNHHNGQYNPTSFSSCHSNLSSVILNFSAVSLSIFFRFAHLFFLLPPLRLGFLCIFVWFHDNA